MADDKSKQDERDRSRVSSEEEYEVQYLAERGAITRAQARELIAKHGNNRDKLMTEAAKLK